jgi:murein DD-endopeptidase MepM/ murein hydrolase activator NlpD
MSILRISISDMAALRVRAAEPGNSPPILLYQGFTPEAMGFMATLPYGTSAVSIGEQSGAYPILKSPPPAPDGFVIVYARKPNHRYEAVEALYRGQSFGIAQFCEIARRHVESMEGRWSWVPGRYAYLAPTREQWGVILRDGGYIALAPPRISADLSAEVIESRKEPLSSGIIARFSLHTGTRSSNSAPLPFFARVEIAGEPNPNPESDWLPFVEYQRIRSIRSRPPDTIVPQFREWLSTLTEECGFASWVIRPGMFFNDHIEWWGQNSRRRTLHEGIDFAEGSRHDTSVDGIPEGSPVRAMADGEVIAVLNDFLNKTVVVRHPDVRSENGAFFHTLYSHIRPCITQAQKVRQGQILGNVGKSKNAGAPAHLHLTGAWIPESISAHEISMDQINPAFAPVVLINFNSLISSQ